jgi:uncharacterized membrane protein YjgN (DUF898 family)
VNSKLHGVIDNAAGFINKTTKQIGNSTTTINRAAIPTKSGSYFEGKLLHGLGWMLLAIIVTWMTFRLGFPWAYCFIYRWKINNTVIEGQRLNFMGNGAGLIGNWITWVFFSIFTFGIYLNWVPRAFTEWKAKNTFFENGTQNKSSFEGSVFDYVGRKRLGRLITIITLGIGFYWYKSNVLAWEINNTVIEGRRLKFNGTASGLFGRWIIWWILSIVTFEIYILFIGKALYKWQVENTTFAD